MINKKEFLNLELKADLALDDRGTVEGIAWPYATADRSGDIIRKGAIKKVVDDIPMLRNHDSDLLIGIWDEVTETDKGFYVKGHFNETSLARGTRAQVKSGRLSALSIGYYNRGSKKVGANRVLTDLGLFEVSIVKDGMHPGAQLTAVKNMDQALAIAEAIKRATAALTRN